MRGRENPARLRHANVGVQQVGFSLCQVQRMLAILTVAFIAVVFAAQYRKPFGRVAGAGVAG